MLRNRVAAILLASFVLFSMHAGGQNQELLRAVQKGNLAGVEDLLQKGADRDSGTDDGTTALMLAAAGGHMEILRALLDAGANVDAQNGAGKTALMAAAARGDTASVLLLLEAGADVHIKTASGETALKAAQESGKTAVTLLLLEGGSDADDTSPTPIPLTEPGVRVMRGAPYHEIIIRERPPLVDAAARGDAETVRVLLDAGADVDETESLLGLTALDMAVLEGHTEIVAMLRQAGAREKKP